MTIGDEEYPEDLEYDPRKKFVVFPEWMDGSQPRRSERQTFTIKKMVKKGQPLTLSGLIGPVTVLSTKTVPLD